MPETKWPENRRVIGTKVSRLDGPAKSVGTAKYGYDINRKGMLQGMILRSPHAHAKIKSIDTSAAEKVKGFKGVFVLAKPGAEMIYAGQEILGIAADTEEHCADCLREVKIDWEVLPHLVTEEAAQKNPDKGTLPGATSNLQKPAERAAGNVDEAFKGADAVVSGTYGVPVQTHSCLETHGMVAEFQGDELTVWCSTQAVPSIANEMAGQFKGRIPGIKTRCITHYMGGGYGCKFNAGVEGRICGELAFITKAPVKLFLDRAEEHVAVGNRPSAAANIKIAGTKDGKITAFAAECWGTPGTAAGVDGYQQLTPYVYAIPNVKNSLVTVRLNCGDRRAFRAAGHPQACYLTESAVDDLANKLGMDPLQLRLKNLPGGGLPNTSVARDALYRTEIEIAAKLAEWDKKWHPPGKGGKGPIKHGIGMAIHTWGGSGRGPNDTKVTISADGSVLTQCSTQDLGTGERTVIPIVVAEVLGLEVKDITSQIGESQFGRSTGSGGSTTCPGTAPAALNAAAAARTALFEKLAPKLGTKPESLAIEPGKIVDKGGGKGWAWKEACAKLGMDTVVGMGDWSQGLSSVTVGGCQIAEVMVDTETGVVRCTKIVAVQDCGLIINKLGCESQVAGGVIMGVNYALFEDRIMDQQTGRQCNPDMEFYKIGGIEDMPEIVVHMHDMPERGVIGIGEPPTISTAAAIANAVCNAVGVRVGRAPFTPDKVLAALAKGGQLMKNFTYHRPTSVEQAVALLDNKWGTTELLAGGTDLLDLQKEYVAQPDKVVSLSGIKALSGISMARSATLIGAATTLAEIAEHEVVKKQFPALADAAGHVGGPQIRNMGTLGGNLCQRNRCWYFRDEHVVCLLKGGPKCYALDGENQYHAIFTQGHKCVIVSPSTLAPPLIALGAVAKVQGAKGKRELPLSKFFQAPQDATQREHVLGPDEIVTAVRIDRAANDLKNASYEVQHKQSNEWPLVQAAVAFKYDGGKAGDVRIVLGQVAPTPHQAMSAAKALEGKEVTEETAAVAGKAACEGARPLSGNAYKLRLVEVAVKRAALLAAGAKPYWEA